MKQFIEKITFKTKKNEMLNITKIIEDTIKKSDINDGLLNISILHTSCSLIDSRKCRLFSVGRY